MDLAESEISIMRQLEERLLQFDVPRSPSALDELLSDDFIEFGSSGRVFNKAQIIEHLQKDAPTQINIQGMKVKALAHDIRLVTYRVLKLSTSGGEEVASLRSSIWKLNNGRWQMVFHQGTRIEEN